MIDRREQILSRLMDIFQTIPGISKVYRNREDVTGRAGPTIILHDANEETADIGGRPQGAVVTKDYINLNPQIYILLGDKSEIVGSRVSELRRLLIVAIWSDSQLQEITGVHRNKESEIRYHGCGLDTATGEAREARLEVRFTFTYLLDVKELV